jgi:plastocyanin
MATAATRLTIGVRAVTVALCIAAAAGHVPLAQAKTWTVKIAGMQFGPATVTVARGDTVVWVNDDVVAHTATSSVAGRFDSRAIAPGGNWRYEADTPGRYPYACTFHPTMQATLIVKEKP